MTEPPLRVVPDLLNDARVRAMADHDHVPGETWNMGGNLVSLHCAACVQAWPCATRLALDEIAAYEEAAARPAPTALDLLRWAGR
jgi:hypothetical protein